MTYINLVPRPGNLRTRIAVAWGVLRGKYAVDGEDDTLYVGGFRLADHVVEVYFEGGTTVLMQWYGPELDDTANMIFLARHGAKHMDADGGGPDLFDVPARSVRLIRRSDAAVFHLLGERIPNAFHF